MTKKISASGSRALSSRSVSTEYDFPLPAQLDVVHPEPRIVGGGGADHLQPQLGGRVHAATLVGRIGGGDEEEAVQLQRRADVRGHDQVSDVRRVEGPAQHTQAHQPVARAESAGEGPLFVESAAGGAGGRARASALSG